MPFTLLAAFILLALTGLFVAALLQRPLVPTRPAGSRGWLLALVAVAGTVAATWAALYTTSIEDAALPVLDWAFFAVPVGLASVIARGADGDDAATHRPFVTGVLVAVPIAAVNGLGWSIYSAPQSGLSISLISDGFGIIAGLTTAHFHHRPEPRPLADGRS